MGVIEIDNISKEYRLGVVNHVTLIEEVQTWTAKLLGRPDPNARIDCGGGPVFSSGSGRFWALKDVSLNVEQGEIIGIIGRNGAGKSTLLKILSRVTSPSRGEARIRGRIASLLEVGTGFHPELTGRENIYLNGAILGMNKREISNKLDEIISFAEVDQFVDTPVKRYSSGMYVRLAFAVAAHLDPEILLVDEVLAVGDLQFQQKCLGKMHDAVSGGRTILFVSHNMGAIRQLCTSCVLLSKGQVAFVGGAEEATARYVAMGRSGRLIDKAQFIGTLCQKLEFTEISINGSHVDGVQISPSSEVTIDLKGMCHSTVSAFRTSIVIFRDGVRLCTIHDLSTPQKLPQGTFHCLFRILPYCLRPGQYSIAVGGHDGGHRAMGTEWIYGNELISFSIAEEWCERNDFSNVGMVNIPSIGCRYHGREAE